MRTLLNFAAFQLGWFACVLSAANGLPWLGISVTGLAIALHLMRTDRPAQEARLILVAIATGFVVDSVLASSGWLRYASPAPVVEMAPFWILAMWALFATTLNVSMSWLKGKPGLAVLLGAVCGPLSYMAGQRLGALEFVDFQAGTLAVAAVWALAMPLLMLSAARYDGTRTAVSCAPLRSPTGRVSAGD